MAEDSSTTADDDWIDVSAAKLKEPLPKSFDIPPRPEQPGIIKQMMPKVYDPMQQMQQDIAENMFGFIPGVGGVPDVVDAAQAHDPVGLTLGMAGMLPIPFARPIVKGAKGIRAWHASPHDFTKFDMSKIGTGQGANSYGRGIYLAENPRVSGPDKSEYWREFTPRVADEVSPRGVATRFMQKVDFDKDRAMRALEMLMREHPADTPALARNRIQAYEHLRADKPVGAHVYEVNINAAPEQFLDWDKTLTKQSPYVQEALRTIHPSNTAYNQVFTPDATGRNMYGRLHRAGASTPGEARQHASEQLQGAGIPGIRYLDQGSYDLLHKPFAMEHISGDPAQRMTFRTEDDAQRHMNNMLRARPAEAEQYKVTKPTPTYNHVVSDTDILKIINKFAIGAGVLGTGAGMVAGSGGEAHAR
jgi:hypothetical protein